MLELLDFFSYKRENTSFTIFCRQIWMCHWTDMSVWRACLLKHTLKISSPMIIRVLGMGTHHFTSPLAEIPWRCSDLDKRSSILPLCSLAKVTIPIATEDFLHWEVFRILVGGSWGGQRVTGGCKHSPGRLLGCTFVLGQLKVDVSCGVLS